MKNEELRLVIITNTEFDGCILNAERNSPFELSLDNKPLSEDLQLWMLLIFSIAYKECDIRNDSKFEISVADISRYTRKGHDIVKKDMLRVLPLLKQVKYRYYSESGFVFEKAGLCYMDRPLMIKFESKYFTQIVSMLCTNADEKKPYWYSNIVRASILGSRYCKSSILSAIQIAVQLSKLGKGLILNRSMENLMTLCPELNRYCKDRKKTVSNRNKKFRVYKNQVMELLNAQYIPCINNYNNFRYYIDRRNVLKIERS